MTDAVWIFYLSAAITGGAFGYVIQRGGFCLMRALSNLYLMGDATIARAYALALLVAMVGVQALATAGLVDFPVRPFHWMSNCIGGLVFGAGMVLAGGCSGSTWYRVGEGAVGAWVILLGFVTGAAVGVLIAAGWWASTIGERPVGLTFAANTGELLTYPLVGFPNRVNWSMVMVIAVPIGAFVAAWTAGDFRWKLPPGWSLVKIFSGGVVMGGSD